MRRETRPSDNLGHNSIPAPGVTSTRASGRDIGTAARHRTQRPLRAADVDALIGQYRAGATVKELAGRFGISRTTVMAHLTRRNVQRRVSMKGGPWRNRTSNLGIKSPLLCQLS